MHHAAGEYAAARPLFERALAIREQTLGPGHPDIAMSLNNLAIVLKGAGQLAEALALHERALAIREQALGPDHPDVAATLNNLAIVHHAMGDHDLVRPRYERALAVLEETPGPDHPTVGLILVGLANVHTFAGAHDLARPLLERAVAIQEAKGSDHRDIARSLERLGEAFLGERRPAQALPLFERDLAIYAAHDGARRREAVAQFGAARALVATGGDRKRALALARAAREGLRRKAHAVGAVDLAEVERWLATQEGEGFRGARPAARRTP